MVIDEEFGHRANLQIQVEVDVSMFVFGSIGVRYNRESLTGLDRYTKQ